MEPEQCDFRNNKEIVAFTGGKRLDEIEKNREYGKRMYQQIGFAILAGVIALIVAGGMFYLLK